MLRQEDVKSGRVRRRPRRADAGLNALGARSEVLRACPVVAATGPPAAPQRPGAGHL